MGLNPDNYSPTDMKTIYNSHHEVQMRLFMMRAQVEQLEAKRNNIKTLQQRIGRIMSVLAAIPEDFSSGGSGSGKKHISTPLSPMPEMSEERIAEKQTIAHVIQAQEDERLRVSRRIHDGPAQTMTNLVLRAEICERLL